MSDYNKVTGGFLHCYPGRVCNGCPYERIEYCERILLRDMGNLIQEQHNTIKEYQKADSFLAAHGWWELAK